MDLLSGSHQTALEFQPADYFVFYFKKVLNY